MQVEKIHKGIRYTLSNDGLEVGDQVFPIGNGRCLEDGGWILHNLDFREIMSGFPDEPHAILNLKHSDYKPYEVQTDYGFSPKECYYKIIKREKQVKVKEHMFGGRWEWVEASI